MWHLSIVPPAESGVAPSDVVLRAEPGATVADLARALGAHYAAAGAGWGTLFAPATDGRAWPAGRLLSECRLRNGSVLTVVSTGAEWMSRPGTVTAPRARVRVIAGPDAGLEVDVDADVVTIGRSRGCTVRLSDPLASRVHARVILGTDPVLCDEGSAHGTFVGDLAVRTAENLAWGQPVTVGDTRLVLEQGSEVPAAEVSVLRPPRLGETIEPDSLDIPAPPRRPRKQQVPWAMIVMPLVLGMAMFAATRSPLSLVYVAVWPPMMMGTYWMQRRQQAKEHEEEVAAWQREADQVRDRLDHAAEVQCTQAVHDEPPLTELRTLATGSDPRLWQRQRRHPDFLALVAGRGPVPALLSATLGTGGDPTVSDPVRIDLAERATLADLPVPIALRDHACAAVAGPDEVLHPALRAMLVRLAVAHSPADVVIGAILSPRHEHLEAWLRWLPHAGQRIGGEAPVALGAHDGQVLLQAALSDTAYAGDVVLLVDQASGLSTRQVESAVASIRERTEDEEPPRVHLVWFGASIDQAPASAGVVIDLTADAAVEGGSVGRVSLADRGGTSPLTHVDHLGLHEAWDISRALISCRDDAALLPPESALPDLVRLPELSSDLRDADDVDGVLRRWSTSRGLRAQVGVGADGIMTLDLREDGPHGLIAGTTGSGKSELLQTLICSLASNNAPSRITFLLVDYKGGAAFRECADLPHTVGYITDLTPALVQRALTSLHAELTWREGLLAQFGAKDLVALEASHPEAAPPSMLICVDEFAALLAEVPEFIEGMVSIAQRGRSLGMHMLLATQRPAGVVTPQIKANTDLRIALRIASEDDSGDVIERPDAARISRRTPGRAWVRRTGHGTCELVQTAFAGAREPRAGEVPPVRVSPFTARRTAGDAVADGTLHARSDLDRLVTTVGDAFARSGVPAPRRPWLPPLATRVEMLPRTTALGLPSLVLGHEAEETAAEEADGRLTLGLLDRPAEQVQKPFVVDYARGGHLLVYGTSGSGKTEALRTIALAAVAGGDPVAPVVYGLDCGGGGLSVVEALPGVGGVVPEAVMDRALRLVRMIHRTVLDRNVTLASHGASDLVSLRDRGVTLPRIHLLIDNLPALVDAIEGGGSARRGHVDLLGTVLQEGRRVGVHVSATTPQRTGLPAAMLASFSQRLVLRMTTEDDYAVLGVRANVIDADSPAGRGLMGADEVQVGTAGEVGTAAHGERLASARTAVEPRYAGRAPVGVPAMPSRLPSDLLPTPAGSQVCLGVDGDFVAGATLDLLDGPLLVLGRSRSGRTEALQGVAELAARSSHPPTRVVLVSPRGTGEDVVGPGIRSVVDVVVSDPAQVRAELDALRASPVSGPDWNLLLVDDAHLWEREGDIGGNFREAIAHLADNIGSAQHHRLAVAVVGDPDEARQRQHLEGPVRAARQGRRTVLLSPEFSDGVLASVTVPNQTVEPASGVGRGLLCTGGTVRVVQLVSAATSAIPLGE